MRQLDRDFSRGRARRRPAGYRVLGRCYRARCAARGTIWWESIRAATRAAPKVRVATTSAIPRRSTVNTTRVRVPKARGLAWERGMGARAVGPHPGEPRLGARMRASGPRSRATTNAACLVPSRPPPDKPGGLPTDMGVPVERRSRRLSAWQARPDACPPRSCCQIPNALCFAKPSAKWPLTRVPYPQAIT